VYTDTEGKYTLWILRNQEYEIEQDDVWGEDRKQTVKLFDFEQDRIIDFTLPQPTTFAFTLPDGAAAKNVDVDICARFARDSNQIVGLKPEADGIYRAVLAPNVNLISVKTKDGKFGANRIVHGDERNETITIPLEPPAIGKVKFVEKETGKPLAGRRLAYYPKKRLSDNLLLMNSFRAAEVRTDKDGVATLSLFVDASYTVPGHKLVFFER
jgi:hypothetical protein